MMKVLTKSRFKLGLECPNKLFYTGKKEYANQKKEDPFLLALADGGFQVEEYARMHYPNGILIEGNDGDYEKLWHETQELLNRENVIIYEAAFLYDGLFVRTDILVKKGTDINLIEVKAKSFDPGEENLFVGKRGGLVSDWKPYLFDIAFQKYVMQQCYKGWNITSSILMADKSKVATVDGLNQFFRVSKNAGTRTGIIKTIDSLSSAGESVLGLATVSEVIERIIKDELPYSNELNFSTAVKLFKKVYVNDEYAAWPTSFNCKSCEFKTSSDEVGLKSGYEECFIKQHNWGSSEFEKPKIFEVWSFRKGGSLFSDGIHFMDQLSEESIGLKEEEGRLSMSARQWLQITKEVNSDSSIYVNKIGLKAEMEKWKFPLHFIDFETSAVPLPFTSGRRPYEQIAFQFSLHTLFEDGRVEHASQFLSTEKGAFPNFTFVKTLKAALSGDDGTIFRYSNHENSILNTIYEQLGDSTDPDAIALQDFIKTITHSKTDSAEKWTGDRDMVDLWEIVKRYYYNPLTKGSNSIKYLLPSILNSSPYLQQKYSRQLNEIALTSLNFSPNHVWLSHNGSFFENPYEKLPRLFADWSDRDLDELISGMEDLANGGAALTAYGKMQYTDISESELKELAEALLRYCELDTLAMVMLYEHLREVTIG